MNKRISYWDKPTMNLHNIAHKAFDCDVKYINTKDFDFENIKQIALNEDPIVVGYEDEFYVAPYAGYISDDNSVWVTIRDIWRYNGSTVWYDLYLYPDGEVVADLPWHAETLYLIDDDIIDPNGMMSEIFRGCALQSGTIVSVYTNYKTLPATHEEGTDWFKITAFDDEEGVKYTWESENILTDLDGNILEWNIRSYTDIINPYLGNLMDSISEEDIFYFYEGTRDSININIVEEIGPNDCIFHGHNEVTIPNKYNNIGFYNLNYTIDFLDDSHNVIETFFITKDINSSYDYVRKINITSSDHIKIKSNTTGRIFTIHRN